MFVIYNKDKGFLSENEDVIGCDYNYELDEYTVTFANENDAIKNSEMGEVVLKVVFHSYA